MPNIVSKNIDDYWFSTNIIDCCNIVPVSNSHVLYMSNKKLYNTDKKQHESKRYLNEMSGRNISTAEDYRNRAADNVVENQRNQRHEKKKKEQTFSKNLYVGSDDVSRNPYIGPKESRWYYLDKRAGIVPEKQPFPRKYTVDIDPSSAILGNLYVGPKKSRWYYLDQRIKKQNAKK